MINYDKLKEEHARVSRELSTPEVFNDRERYCSLAKRFSYLEKIVAKINEREKCIRERAHLEEMVRDVSEDKEMKDLAQHELLENDKKTASLDEEIEAMLFEDENEPDRDIIIEIRAAAGGDEAALFAADLFKMYSKYIERNGWKQEVLSSHPTGIGGYKEIVFSVRGQGCLAHLKFESGVHRVQRVPETESGGRIHTSTATVAMLMEPKNVELMIDPQDLRIDTFRSSGAGGQHVNRTDSAVRMTHLSSGLVVVCQDERSQIKNREKALRVMRARLLDKKQREEQKKISTSRKVQIGTGDRSEKIRTYNFPERRVTEHRINLTLYKLESILEGGLDEIVTALIREERKKLYEAKGLG